MHQENQDKPYHNRYYPSVYLSATHMGVFVRFSRETAAPISIKHFYKMHLSMHEKFSEFFIRFCLKVIQNL